MGFISQVQSPTYKSNPSMQLNAAFCRLLRKNEQSLLVTLENQVQIRTQKLYTEIVTRLSEIPEQKEERPSLTRSVAG